MSLSSCRRRGLRLALRLACKAAVVRVSQAAAASWGCCSAPARQLACVIFDCISWSFVRKMKV